MFVHPNIVPRYLPLLFFPGVAPSFRYGTPILKNTGMPVKPDICSIKLS
jgi:hypothetical protein